MNSFNLLFHTLNFKKMNVDVRVNSGLILFLGLGLKLKPEAAQSLI